LRTTKAVTIAHAANTIKPSLGSGTADGFRLKVLLDDPLGRIAGRRIALPEAWPIVATVAICGPAVNKVEGIASLELDTNAVPPPPPPQPANAIAPNIKTTYFDAALFIAYNFLFIYRTTIKSRATLLKG
jgi:hypothetical protein